MKKDKLKILIVSFSFPPLNSSGAMRPYSWAKYWSKLGHDICVLTGKKESFLHPLNLSIDPQQMQFFRIEEVSFWPFTKSKSNKKRHYIPGNLYTPPPVVMKVKEVYSILQKFIGSTLDYHHLWILPAIRRALSIYREWPFTIIVSSYGPPACHIIGGILKRKLGIFWVADYRDLWYGNHLYSLKWPFSHVEKNIEHFFVKEADLITTVSNPLKEKLIERFGNNVITIENGFDVEELNKIGKQNVFPQDGKVRLIYTGTIYPEKRDPSPLFEAVKFLKKQGLSIEEKLEIIFYGVNLGNLHALIKKYDLHNIVKTPGFVDRETVLQIQRSADALIFLEWEDPSIDGILTGKLFEYMYSGSPILGIGVSTRTAAGKLIEEAGIGLAVGKSIEKIAYILEKLINGEKLNYSPSQEVLNRYTRERLAKRMLEEILKHLS